MNALKLLFYFALCSLSILFGACTSMKFTSIWKDEAYQGRAQKILVINAFPNPTSRKIFEDEFVKALKDRGVNAVESSSVIPDTILSDNDAIAAQAKAVGADTVLINRPLNTRLGKAVGTDYMDVYIITQTDIYEMKSNKLVFSASAEIQRREDEPYAKQIQSYVNQLVNALSKQGFF